MTFPARVAATDLGHRPAKGTPSRHRKELVSAALCIAMVVWSWGCRQAAVAPQEPRPALCSLESRPFTIVGRLTKQPTVGYRSPYRLCELDAENLAILARAAGAPRQTAEVWGDPDRLEAVLGKRVRLGGRYVSIPGGTAEPGSEAASRFVGGVVPTLERFEVSSIEVE